MQYSSLYKANLKRKLLQSLLFYARAAGARAGAGKGAG